MTRTKNEFDELRWHAKTVDECVRLCDWKIVYLGDNIHPAAKRVLEEMKGHIEVLKYERLDS